MRNRVKNVKDLFKAYDKLMYATDTEETIEAAKEMKNFLNFLKDQMEPNGALSGLMCDLKDVEKKKSPKEAITIPMIYDLIREIVMAK